MPPENYADLDPEEFERRVRYVHEVLAEEGSDPIDWFRRHVGRSRHWVERRFSGAQPIPIYAATILEQLSEEAGREQAISPVEDRRRDRAAEFCDELAQIRTNLRDGSEALFEALEVGETALRQLSEARRRLHHAFGNILERLQRSERIIREEIDAPDEAEFGDREGNESDARQMRRGA